jgi:hypothetical protein
MTADFVAYMEKRAYTIARQEDQKESSSRRFCYPTNEQERVAMHELFDMVAGSETGAIIAATLAEPAAVGSTKAKHYAGKAAEFFEKQVDVLYVDAGLGAGWQVLIYIVGILVFGVITYMAAFYYFRDKAKKLRI